MIAITTMMLGITRFFLLQHRTNLQQEEGLALEQNLRLGSAMITDALRNTRYGLEPANPSSWITWVPGMTSNPNLTDNTSPTPDALSVAGCFQEPVATLATGPGAGGVWPAGTTTLTLTPTNGSDLTTVLDTTSRGLVRIGDSAELALLTSVGTSSITINTNPGGAVQGLVTAHPQGAEICRVDVVTFSIGNDPTTGVPRLLRDDNQGAGVQPLAEGISDLQITTPSPPKQYQVTLKGRSEHNDPVTGAPLQRTLITVVSLRN